MDADHAELLGADALEAVDGLGRDDDDVPGAGYDLLVAGGEARLARLDDEDLGVRVGVEVGALALVVLRDEDRDGDVVLALE